MFSICVDILVVTSTLYVIVWVESYVLRISRKHRFKQGESLWPLRTNSNDFGAHTRYTLNELSAKDASDTTIAPPDSCLTAFLSRYLGMFLNLAQGQGCGIPGLQRPTNSQRIRLRQKNVYFLRHWLTVSAAANFEVRMKLLSSPSSFRFPPKR